MSTLGATNPTLLDVTKAMAPGGSIDIVAEILNETNEILDDMTMIEGNLPTGHRTTVRTGIPAPTWRQLYGGVQPTKSTRAQITDSCGMLEAYAEIDKALADLNGNSAAFRLSEDRAHIEGMSQEAAATVFQGDESLNPERFTGLNKRFNSSTAENGQNIIKGGSADTDNASIWLVGWGPNSVHGIYPKGSMGGLHMEDKGQVTIENADGSNGRMEAYRSHYRWDLGLTVRDWRYVVRIPNIERSALKADASSGANLPELMFQATELVPNLSGARFAFYMDRSIRTKVRQQLAAGVSGSTLTVEDVGGKRVMSFDSIPMRRVDALSADEALVS
jgi:hypothetical protein